MIRTLFVIDAIGAAASALASLFILFFHLQLFGLPVAWLAFTIAFSAIILLYDLLYLFTVKKYRSAGLGITALMNCIFAVSALVFVSMNFRTIAPLGVLYVAAEICIVGTLVGVQIRAMRSTTHQ